MSDVFHCVDSGFCIPSKWKCDGEFDCADRTDEKQCSEGEPDTTTLLFTLHYLLALLVT